MTLQSVTLHLPESLLRRAKHMADALHHPVEEVLADTLAAALPEVEGAPLDMQAELARMTWLGDQELWAIARGDMPDDQQARLTELGDLHQQRPLTLEEQQTLETLRQSYGQVTLRKARAYALLSLRGGRPLLADN